MTFEILVVGNGAREHALSWKLLQSPQVGSVICAPGNAGTAAIAENVNIGVFDLDALVGLAKGRNVDLVVIGPEAPLAAGLSDRVREEAIPVFGPSTAAARIESSKSWSKNLMREAGVPTARSLTHSDRDEALSALGQFGLPVVVKADGLAAGKGVIIATTEEDAQAAIHSLLDERALGEAGATIVIEEFLDGMELSIFGLTDGETILPFLPSCDYKRAGTGDTGPNTGGMGAYAPVPRATPELISEITSTILQPVVEQMNDRDCRMNGALYAGLMLTDDGPKVLEFNARFGDPEIQVLLPLLTSDFAPLLDAVANNRLAEVEPLEWESGAAVGVVLASGGYPGSYETGHTISGLNDEIPGTHVFQAGTSLDDSGVVVTAGGRVLTAVGTGTDLEQARNAAYERANTISFQDLQFRTDIAAREIVARSHPSG